jgi:hypothetical protein
MRLRHAAVMAVVYSVLGDTEGEAANALRRLCLALGLEVLGEPSEILGRGRWLARATPPDTPEPPPQ